MICNDFGEFFSNFLAFINVGKYRWPSTFDTDCVWLLLYDVSNGLKNVIILNLLFFESIQKHFEKQGTNFREGRQYGANSVKNSIENRNWSKGLKDWFMIFENDERKVEIGHIDRLKRVLFVLLQNSARFLTEWENFYSVKHLLNNFRVLQRQRFVDNRNSFNNFRYCRFLLQIGIV